MSSEIYIYLKMERYLGQYVTHHWGDPIRLSSNSPEAKLVRRFLDKNPKDTELDSLSDEDITTYYRLEIPWSKEKDPRVYNYLYPGSKKLLIDYFESILVNNMCTELLELSCDPNIVLSDLILAYCEKHGMTNIDDQKNFETIRQKFYRARKKYMEENNVKLS
ncbi:hypothetical protein [Dysgonomonas macrotermitis]|uniref:Uncharacterized protein n=1 Tax=Dysgonomonas macrotermitis TaxID=1346286 RepID=A0A1M4ULM5_9BACT|nr:hypothetical protein [Dysgonomonas macrotermitis]SHE57555.1 hypothetical protein SAMN05444362_101639 [Dysgonomonas macrotermitis]